MNRAGNNGNNENPWQSASLPSYGRKPETPKIIRLCRQFAILAIGATIIFLLNISMNTWIHSRYRSTALSLPIMAGAVYYGWRIARQARLDAERTEKSLEDARQRALEIAALAALYDTTQDVSESHDLKLLLDTVLDRATNLLAVSGGAIFLYDAEYDDFHIAAETCVGMPVGTHLPFDEGLGGQVVKNRVPLIVNDYQNWKNRSSRPRELPISAAVCVPMIRNKELIGVLGAHEVTGAPKKIFTHADARILSLFADNVAGVVHDARLVEKLRRSEERLRIASECTSDLVYERDLVTDTARFFSSGADSAELSDAMEILRNSIHPQDRERVWTALQNHMKAGTPFSAEYRIEDAGGGYITVLDRAITILNRNGTPVRMIGASSDITERKRAEQFKSDFISFVTHQLRTPLSGVKWMLELAMDAKDDQEEMQAFIADARLSTERLVCLANDLLDASRLEQGKQKASPQRIDLEKLTRDTAAEMNSLLLKMNHTLTIEAVNNPLWPNAERSLMRQAIMNLLSNSIKYTPAEGAINIRILAEQGFVRWEIKDTGIGIPQNNQEKLFEKFYRADNVLSVETEGAGLGLYLTRLIIERFGGRIWCESKEGAGSKFIFLLPAVSRVRRGVRRETGLSADRRAKPRN